MAACRWLLSTVKCRPDQVLTSTAQDSALAAVANLQTLVLLPELINIQSRWLSPLWICLGCQLPSRLYSL